MALIVLKYGIDALTIIAATTSVHSKKSDVLLYHTHHAFCGQNPKKKECSIRYNGQNARRNSTDFMHGHLHERLVGNPHIQIKERRGKKGERIKLAFFWPPDTGRSIRPSNDSNSVISEGRNMRR